MSAGLKQPEREADPLNHTYRWCYDSVELSCTSPTLLRSFMLRHDNFAANRNNLLNFFPGVLFVQLIDSPAVEPN